MDIHHGREVFASRPTRGATSSFARAEGGCGHTTPSTEGQSMLGLTPCRSRSGDPTIDGTRRLRGRQSTSLDMARGAETSSEDEELDAAAHVQPDPSDVRGQVGAEEGDGV